MSAQKNNISKEAETKILNELFERGSYLADAMEPLDIDQMRANIANDFPLFLNTSIDKSGQISALQARNLELDDRNIELLAGQHSRDQRIQDLENEVKELKDKTTKLIGIAIRNDNEEELMDVVEHEEVIRIKLQVGLPLNDADAQALLNIMDMVE